MQGERLEAVRRGAKAFLDGMKPADEAMLALFSDRLLRFTPFPSDKKALDASIAGTPAAGGTAVNDFLYLSLKLLDARQGQRVVVLFSDGSDVHSVLPASDVLWKARAGQSLDLLDPARRQAPVVHLRLARLPGERPRVRRPSRRRSTRAAGASCRSSAWRIWRAPSAASSRSCASSMPSATTPPPPRGMGAGTRWRSA